MVVVETKREDWSNCGGGIGKGRRLVGKRHFRRRQPWDSLFPKNEAEFLRKSAVLSNDDCVCGF
uniref:Uncharacterized protein n=1 Tax=Physcomitrium patens TaxID=3218 RepID=A0A2K1IXE6_PHYPA|nr:hypothetical protein PHYPA_023747 [Physcomitrium patens]